MTEKIDQKFEDRDGLTEEIWKIINESDKINKGELIFLEKNPDVIKKVAVGKEYETLLDRYDSGLFEEFYYDGLIDLVKKEISYKKLKIKSEIVSFKNLIWDKITFVYDGGKIETEDYEMIENNKDVLDDWVEENYEKLFEIKDEKNEEKLKNKILEIISQILKEIAEKEKKEGLSPKEEKKFNDLENKLKKILDEVDAKLGNNSIKGAERDELRNKQTELGAILRALYNKEDSAKILKYIKEAKNLSGEEKGALFKISGTSADELIEKEGQEKEIIERIKAKFREYITIEDRIINQENAKSAAERNEKRIGAAETRKKVYEHVLSRADWDLETYRKAVESNHDKTKGFTTISDRRYEELIKIIAGEKASPAKEKDFEIKRRKIFETLKNREQEIGNKLLNAEEFFIKNIEGKVNEDEEKRVNVLLNDANQAFSEFVKDTENRNFDEAENRFNEAMETVETALNLMTEILKAKKEELTPEEKAKKETLDFFGVEIGDRVVVVNLAGEEYKGIVSGVEITPLGNYLGVDMLGGAHVPIPKEEKFRNNVKKEKIIPPEYAECIKKMEEIAEMLKKEYDEKIKDSEFITDKVKSDFFAALQEDKRILEELKAEAGK